MTKADFKKADRCRGCSPDEINAPKNKAALAIEGMASVERCLQKCLEIQNVDEVILATSTMEEDAGLKNHTLGGKVKFFQGIPMMLFHVLSVLPNNTMWT